MPPPSNRWWQARYRWYEPYLHVVVAAWNAALMIWLWMCGADLPAWMWLILALCVLICLFNAVWVRRQLRRQG